MADDIDAELSRRISNVAREIRPNQPDPRAIRNATPIATTRSQLSRWAAPLAAAAAVGAVTTSTLLITHADRGEKSQPAAIKPVISQASTPIYSTPASVAPSKSATRPVEPPACNSAQLHASVDASRSGVVHGAGNVILLFQNTSSTACWFSGLPTLLATASDGSDHPLPFHKTADPGYANPSPAGGPGSLDPGKFGAMHLTMQIDGCTVPATTYTTLKIPLEHDQVVRLTFPPQLALSGCFGDQAPMGPIIQ